jgi:hypothetical protein
MSIDVATLKATLVADTDRFNAAMGMAAKTTNKTGRGLAKFGTAAKLAMLAGGAAAVKFGKDSVEAFGEAQRVAAQTNAVLKSTGGAANVSAKDIGRLASSLSKMSGVDDEAIQSGENLLLTFTKIRNETGKGNDIFNQGTKAALNMSVAMGTDMKSSVIQVGKALNDPIKGVTALSRVGVSFTQGQKDQIKALVESGKTMDAQKLILKELTTEFGGSAKAAGDTFPGQINKLKVAFGDLQEKVGGFIINGLMAAAKWFEANRAAIERFGAAASKIAGAVLGKLWDAITTGVSKIKALVDGFKRGDAAAVAITATLAGLVAGFVAFKVITSVIAAFTALRAAIIAVNVAMAANPVVLVIAALVALGAGLVIAYKKSETFRDVVKGAFTVVRNVAAAAFQVLTFGFRMFLLGLEKVLGAATKLPIVGKKFEGARDAVRAARQEVEALDDKIRGLPTKKTFTFTVVHKGESLTFDSKKHGLTQKPRKPKAKGSSAESRPLFGLEEELAGLEKEKEKLSKFYETKDTLGRISALKHKANHAKESSDRKAARSELAELQKQLGRTRSLAKLDLKITGVERARQMRDALKAIGDQLKGKVGEAVDKYRTEWQKTAGAAFDAQTDVLLANTEVAKELAALRAEETAQSRAEEQKRVTDRIAAAMESGDAVELLEAQGEAATLARTDRIRTLEEQFAADSKRIGEERVAEKQRMEDAAVAAFEASLDQQMARELAQLEERKQSYATFVKDVQAILAPLGLGFEADAGQEMVLGTPAPGASKTKKPVKKKAKKRALGGLIGAGEWSWVGERGPELVRLPSGSRVFPTGENPSGGGGQVFNINVSGALDADATARSIQRMLLDLQRRSGTLGLT